ncbi:(1-3)-beta-glucanase [Chlorella sorokiniana]|uniref:(1-3)-beta-glucanase n=1 Tax=Chlorella sorokiniana TaxID=3076 RepID=A0A2P6TZX5_CHLSO|nr:(1-3)-beta-glucanase [Chlorella sorokiniana]|eukprot:PRW59615.1 (1-3)-beta-glucanase [Chlorella sorokiniana]
MDRCARPRCRCLAAAALLLAAAALLALAAPAAAGPMPFIVPDGAVKLWADDFDAPRYNLNSTLWARVTGKPQWQLQTFTTDSTNLAVAQSVAYINAVKQGGSYTSARIRSRASWHPGMKLADGRTLRSVHIQVRAQVPSPGQGLLASCLLEPVANTYGAWPASGEIGLANLLNGMKSVEQGIHFGGAYPSNKHLEVWTPQANDQPFSGGFHTFAVDWTADTITTYMDSSITGKFRSKRTDATNGWWSAGARSNTRAPFDKPFALSLFVAVGDPWTGAPAANTPFPATLAVDFVRVWGVPA